MELCRRHDASAQAAREEALKFAKETCESVKREAAETMDQLDAARETLKVETAAKHEELAAAEQKFAADSEVARAT